MVMTVVSSGSAGNCYVLQGMRSSLLLECGVRPEKVMTAVPKLDWSKITGALVTHEHGDHAGYVDRYRDLGIDIFASGGTLKRLGIIGQRRTHVLKPMESRWVGEYLIRPFMVHHDADEPLGFIVDSRESGKILFVTDTKYVGLNFKKMQLDHIMVEANYDDGIIDEKVFRDEMPITQAARVRASHMSISSTCELLRANDTGNLKTVTLIHLSDRNGDPEGFVRRAEQSVLFAKVQVARPGLSFDMVKDEISFGI